MKRIEQFTGKRVSPFDLARRGISAQPESDISEWGYPFLELTEKPEPLEGMQVVEGPDEEYEPGRWRQQWLQEPIEPEVPEVPYSITRAQGKAILIIDGIWDDVLTAVAAIADPTQKALAEIAMNEQVTWLRDSPTLLTLAAALGLTEEQIDDMFIRAAQVRF